MHVYDARYDYQGAFVDRWNTRLKKTRVTLAVLGVLLVAAGGLVMAAPYGMYVFAQAAAGIALIIQGAGHVFSYFDTPEFFRSTTRLVSGILNVVLGILFLALPVFLTAGTLVFLLAFLFILTGAERLSFAHHMRYFELPNAPVCTVTGVINIVLGVVFLLMPVVTTVVLPYIVAAYLMVGGVSLLIEAISIKHIDK